MTNPDLIELAMRMVQGTGTVAVAPNAPAPTAVDHARERLQPAPQQPVEAEKPPALPSAPASVGLTRIAWAKDKKSADELAAMILDDLSRPLLKLLIQCRNSSLLTSALPGNAIQKMRSHSG